MFRDGSNNLEYICKAQAKQNTFTWAFSGGDALLTNLVDASGTSTITTPSAHGLAVGNKVVIGTSGVTGLNGTYTIVGVSSTTTFTISTSGVTDNTYNSGNAPNMTISTTAPLSFKPYWSIQRMYYTTTYIDRVAWADGDTSTTKICDSRTGYAYN